MDHLTDFSVQSFQQTCGGADESSGFGAVW